MIVLSESIPGGATWLVLSLLLWWWSKVIGPRRLFGVIRRESTERGGRGAQGKDDKQWSLRRA